MRHLLRITFALLVVLPLCRTADARIKLATQPTRERVEIQLENGRYTLVEEERIVPLLRSKDGRNNFIDFAWANTRIDKDSIQFRPIAIRTDDGERGIAAVEGKPEVQVVNVAYPPNENALVWEVYAKEACAVRVRVSYLIANLTRTFAYRALANPEETELLLKQYLQVRNYSGEDFGSAAGVYAGFGPRFLKRIGQQQDIKMLLARFHRVPIEKTFSFDWYAHGRLNPDKPYASRILMHYVLTNDEENGLGRFPLQPGKARIFIQDGSGGEAFLGEDWARLTPLDDRMKLYLGEARDIVCTRTIQDNKRHKVQGNLFNQEIWLKYEIENFRDKPAQLDIREQLNRLAAQYGRRPHGDVEWALGKDTTPGLEIDREQGAALPTFRVALPARPKDPNAPVEKTTVILHLQLRNLW